MAGKKNQQRIPGLGDRKVPEFTAAFDAGRRAHAQGKLVDAISHYVRAAELNPDGTDLWNDLGAAYLELGRLDEAEEALVKALALRPEFPLALNNLGNLQKRRCPYLC